MRNLHKKSRNTLKIFTSAMTSSSSLRNSKYDCECVRGELSQTFLRSLFFEKEPSPRMGVQPLACLGHIKQ